MRTRRNNGTPSRGQRSKFPAIALGLSLAMAAPTFGAITINSDVSVGTGNANDKYKIGDSADGHLTVTGAWIAEASEVGSHESFEGILTVAVGGDLDMAEGGSGETFVAADGKGTNGTVNVYGTAAFNELKLGQYSAAEDDDGILNTGFLNVGNGTDVASATITWLQASTSAGQSTIIIENSSTVTLIDGMRLDTGAYLNLVGTGRLRIATAGTIESGLGVIHGDGVLGNYEVNTGTGDDVGYDVYTVGSGAASSTLAITSITKVGAKWELKLEGDVSTAYEFYSSTTLVFDPGAMVTGLTASVGAISGGSDEVVTTDPSGDATVQMTLAGLANFVRAVGP